jgi:hypothetical protein
MHVHASCVGESKKKGEEKTPGLRSVPMPARKQQHQHQQQQQQGTAAMHACNTPGSRRSMQRVEHARTVH